jgi:uncharacterized protein (TIGR03067 family)
VSGLLEQEPTRAEVIRRDTQRLQGSWRFFSGPREAQLRVEGERFTMRFRNGDVYTGHLTLVPTNRPRAMDLRIDSGPEPHVGKVVLAIYQFDGPYLIWAPGEPGSPHRPRTFPPNDDRESLCIIFRRDEEANSTEGVR